LETLASRGMGVSEFLGDLYHLTTLKPDLFIRSNFKQTLVRVGYKYKICTNP
jgi:hypothetical protein